MPADKEQLIAEVRELSARVKGAVAVEGHQVAAAGRPFDPAAALLGGNLDLRFPAGPAFVPYGYRATWLNLTAGISFQDVAATFVGAGVFYAMGFQYGEGGDVGVAGTRRRQPARALCLVRIFPRTAPHLAHASLPAAPTLGVPRLSGHRLGAVLTIPIFFIGYTSGLKRAYARHLGLIENGNESVFKGYKVDSSVPYFLRHKVSDRRLE